MISDEQERLGYLALGLLPGLGAVQIREFLLFLKEAGFSLPEFLTLSHERRYGLIPPNSDLHVLIDRIPQVIKTAQELDRYLASKNMGWFTSRDEIYPERILRFMRQTAPFLFFYKGNIELLKRDFFLGIVGTRNPTPAGKEAAYDIAKDIAQQDIVIVSGGAKGIDSAAHKGGLKKGSTIIVLPYGIKYTGRLHVFQRDFNPGNHLILSEFHPNEAGTKTTPILRNRTVAALSDALLIAETGMRGGTLHTLRCAREYGKPFMVLDFSPEKNPPGNASLISTIKGSLPVSDKEKRTAAIIKALEKGAHLLKKETSRQTSLFT